MDVFEAIRRRVSIRHYEERPVERGDLLKLALAAHKAPTAGNAPYRRVMIIDDRDTIEMIRLVAPGYMSSAPAALLIYTDLRVVEGLMWRRGREVTPLIDAGAAAENAALAAVALGLGTCFTKSYNELGLRKVLDIPDNFRTELLLQVGYPAPDRPSPVRKKLGSTPIYINRHGVEV